VKIRAKITGSRVHDVGYRPFLIQKGLEIGLTGLWVKNRTENGKQVIQILVEGEDGEIREFTEFIKSNFPENAEAESVESEDYSNSVPSIEKTMNSQMFEQIVYKGIPAILELRKTGDQMLGKQDIMIDKQDQMLGKQDIMIDKQDQMLGKQDIMIDKQDQMLGKQDIMIDKQDETVDEIKERGRI
jgi:acylphosphatase